jgi:hypothetical protein
MTPDADLLAVAPVAMMRALAPALDRDDVVAIGEANSTVHLYSVATHRPAATISTVLQFGGDRLALCTPGESLVIVAAAWERHGVCGYDGRNGDRLWQRKDLKRAGPLSPAGDGSQVAIALNNQAMQVLDAASGTSVASVRGAQRLWQSRHGEVAAYGAYQHLGLIDTQSWTRSWTAPVAGFALLDVAFAVDELLATDTGVVGTVYAFDLDGRERWRQRLPAEMLGWTLAWDDASDEWVGLAHNVNRSTGDLLLRWGRDGETLSVTPLASVAAARFLPVGRRLITERHVVDARTGAAVPLSLPDVVG